MDEKPVIAPLTVATSMDAAGNVVVWDNGPQDPGGDHNGPEWKQYEVDAKAWKAAGGLPHPSTMAAADANLAISIDPLRYSLEPLGVDSAAVATKIKEIQDRRAAAKKAAQARLDAAELANDRKEAIAAVMADQVVAAVAKKAADLEARRNKPGSAPPPPKSPNPF